MEVIAMSYPDIATALGAAHREDLLRLAAQDRVMTRNGRRARGRLVEWLDAQRLRRRPAAAIRTAVCSAVTR